MGSDISASTIHTIDDSPENKEMLLKEFRENDKDNDGKLEKIQFYYLISIKIPEFLNFVDVIFAIFSEDGKYLTRGKFIEFCDSFAKLVQDKENPKSLIMLVFNYMDKNGNGYLGVNEIHSLMKLIYDSKPNHPKIKKNEAEKLIRSQKPANILKGLSKIEFIRMFLKFHPIASDQKKRQNEIEKKNKFMDEQLAVRRMQNINEVNESNRIVLPYELRNSKAINKEKVEIWKQEFTYADEKKKDALNQKGVVTLLQNQSLVPSSFAYLITELYGVDHYINFDGYRDLMMSLTVFKEDESSFGKTVFKRYDTEKKGYLTINQCIRFGRDICLNEISNSRKSWNARLRECRTIYNHEQIDYEYFYQIMFSLQ